MDESGDRYVKWNKPGTEKKFLMILLVCGV
jgi:hypothetical protein